MPSNLNDSLPEDFVQKVLEHVRANQPAVRDSVGEAILAVLHRPLTSTEKWAIIDQAAANSPQVKLRQEVIDRIARGGRR